MHLVYITFADGYQMLSFILLSLIVVINVDYNALFWSCVIIWTSCVLIFIERTGRNFIQLTLVAEGGLGLITFL